jgi:hypothetical protein
MTPDPRRSPPSGGLASKPAAAARSLDGILELCSLQTLFAHGEPDG